MNIIKKLFEYIIFSVGSIARIIYPYKFSVYFNLCIHKIYTVWISNQFKEFGKGSLVKCNINLIGGNCIIVGSNVKIGNRTTLTAWEKHENNSYSPVIEIGDKVAIGDDAHISSINKIILGNNVLIGKKVTIVDNSHGEINSESIKLPAAERKIYSSGPIIIENNVWIGDKSTILGNVTIGENSIIGANSVVTRNIPANCVVGGVPAKIIKYINN